MKKEETSNQKTRKMLLSKAIFNTFGQRVANEIQDNCTFVELEPDRIGIQTSVGVSFNDIEKAKIRKCIKEVYGEEVKIIAASTKPITTILQTDSKTGLAKSEVLVSNSQNNPQWLQFKANLLKVLLKKHEEKIAQHIVKNWFDKLDVSEESNNDKLILIGSSFVIHWINNNYVSVTENAVLAGNFTVELHYEGNRERPIVLSKQTITKTGN